MGTPLIATGPRRTPTTGRQTATEPPTTVSARRLIATTMLLIAIPRRPIASRLGGGLSVGTWRRGLMPTVAGRPNEIQCDGTPPRTADTRRLIARTMRLIATSPKGRLISGPEIARRPPTIGAGPFLTER
jgi:hypothetical protein